MCVYVLLLLYMYVWFCLLSDEDCEADSFVGQGPSGEAPPFGGGPPVQGAGSGTPGNATFFQGAPSGGSDPFAQVGHFPPPQPLPPTFSQSQASSAPTQPPPPGASSFLSGPSPPSGPSQTGSPASVAASPSTWTPPPSAGSCLSVNYSPYWIKCLSLSSLSLSLSLWIYINNAYNLISIHQ